MIRSSSSSHTIIFSPLFHDSHPRTHPSIHLNHFLSTSSPTTPSHPLLIRQKRRPFPLLIHDNAAWNGTLTRRHRDTHQEEKSANGKRKDPLELQDRDLGEKLADTGCFTMLVGNP
jgi:hypothetical protein